MFILLFVYYLCVTIATEMENDMYLIREVVHQGNIMVDKTKKELNHIHDLSEKQAAYEDMDRYKAIFL